jgi:NAD(P)-dependent dehydrogenase (short-subunit alcohol dehydrogenase family)
MTSLAGQTVVVVGGSSGLGFATAKASLAEGASVIVCSPNESKLQMAKQRLGGGDKVRTEVLDVRSESAVKAFFEKTGKVDHLVFTVHFNDGHNPNLLFSNLILFRLVKFSAISPIATWTRLRLFWTFASGVCR